MAKMTVNEGVFELLHTVTGTGTFTDLIATQNTFVDKNISIKITVPAAGTKSLAITDKPTTTITPGTVNTSGVGSGYYPLTTSLDGTMTFSSAGWVTTDGQSATDSSVIVGRIAQSTLKNGSTTISSGSTVYPNPTTTQTINIEAGYNTARTVVIGAMSGGTQAAASVTISGTATAPTLANTTSGINGKTQITINNNNIYTASSSITSSYYLSLTAGAPATTPTVQKSVDTAGYLGPTGTTTQISSSGSISANSTQFFIPMITAEITVGGNSSQVGTITVSKYNTDGSNNGVNVNSTAFTGSPSTSEPTSGNYVAVNVVIPAKAISPTISVTTPGWVGVAGDITASNVTSTTRTQQVYIPLTTGELAAGAGVANASSGNITLGTKTTTQPSSGKYITVTGSGSVSVGTAGYLPTSTAAKSSNTATAYYPIANLTSANFSATGGKIKSTSAGWLDANVEVADLGTGTLANQATSGQTYTTVTSPAILTSDGYLYINKGYFANTKISLGTLIPDSDTTDVVSGAMLQGYEAFDTNGARIVGGISTYDGDYTSSGWTA